MPEQLQDLDYLRRVRRIREAAISIGLSTTRLLEDMLRYGPSKFDIILTYESLAISTIKTFPTSRWGGLRVFYPTYTVWNDHPVVQLTTGLWNEEEEKAAQLWIRFLLGPKMQAKALDYGFRPGDPTIAIEKVPQNPFETTGDAGVRLQLPTAAIENEHLVPLLLSSWDKATSTPTPIEAVDGGVPAEREPASDAGAPAPAPRRGP